MTKDILLLGNPALYNPSIEVQKDELEELKPTIQDLHDTLINFRETYHVGRAIAAPQIGVFKRLLYMYIDNPVVFINPRLTFPDEEMIEVMDDCMSFPGLLVKVDRHKRCVIHYKDENWNDCEKTLEDDLSELLQHEYDHLDGILAVMRAKDKHSLFLKETVK